MTGKIKTVTAAWAGELKFTATALDGSAVQMSPDGFTPMEMLLLGLAGCTGMDVVDILRKKRAAVAALEIQVRGEQAPEYPMKFTRITVNYIVTGRAIDPEAVRHAIELSDTKYCSAAATLRGTAEIETRFEIRESSAAV